MAMKDYKELWLLLLLIIGLGLVWLALGGPENTDNPSPFLGGGSGRGVSEEQSDGGEKREEEQKESEEEEGDDYSYTDYNPPILEPYIPKRVTGVSGRIYEASRWYQDVNISRGNASRVTDPDEEYITLSVSSRLKRSVPITGWILENGRDRILFEDNGSVRRGRNSSAVIGSGVSLFLNERGQNTHTIVVEPGSRVVVTTGDYPDVEGVNLETNFRLNKCMGYLTDELEDGDRGLFSFFRSSSCPRPRDEEGVDILPRTCYDFVRSLGTCENPTTREMREANLSSYCREYVRDHFNYRACLANHALDKDFYRKEWRVYLGRENQLWQSSREVITLYDSEGRLVDQLAY